jgi:hypothetical protein
VNLEPHVILPHVVYMWYYTTGDTHVVLLHVCVAISHVQKLRVCKTEGHSIIFSMNNNSSPLLKIFQLFLSYSFSFLNLVINNEFRILVEHWVLSTGQRFKLFQYLAWINVRWCRILKVVGLLNDRRNIAGIAMVDEILQGSTNKNSMVTIMTPPLLLWWQRSTQ